MDEEIKNSPIGGESKSELEICQQKTDEYLNNWKRERADFINYKNEEIKRIGMLAQYTKEENILKILPVLDSIYLAEKQMSRWLSHRGSSIPKESGPEELQMESWMQGFFQIQKQIDMFLQREGIEKIEVIDKPFDPNTMEVIEGIDNKEAQPGIVIEEVQKGYRMDDKVLRPARVKISK